VWNNNELKKFILSGFHVNPYLDHLGYHNTLTIVKKFYYWPNIKNEVAEFFAICLGC